MHIFKGHLCGTLDLIDTEVRGDSAQESESTSNSSMFGCEILILLCRCRKQPLHPALLTLSSKAACVTLPKP